MFSKFTVQKIIKRPRYPDLQNAARCADIVIIDWPIGIYMFNECSGFIGSGVVSFLLPKYYLYLV